MHPHHQQLAAAAAAAVANNHGHHGSPEAMKMFKPCTTKTSIVNRSFDEMGNLLWQQEAAEFVEQYPQRRRPKTAALLLRQSASAGTLYRKPETVMPILNKRASGGELLTAQQRHQRDLFSGELGIPDVNSHVGSMVHTFENMALQRRLAERQREQQEREHSKYIAELMALQAAAETQSDGTTPTASAAIVATTTTTKRTFIPSSGTHSSNNSKFQQLKKKTHETRQKIIQQILQNHPLHKDVTNIQSTPRHLQGARQASSNSEVYYRNIDEDYRKNLFGTLTKRKINPQELPQVINTTTSDVETSSFCDEIVAQAFDEIFEAYSGLEEDDEELQETKKSTTTLMPGFGNTCNFLKQYGKPGLTPKKLPPLMLNKKSAAPPPPAAAAYQTSSSSHTKRKIMPFLENKHRSSTIHNLFERLKTPPKKVHNNNVKLNKTPSDSLLKTEPLFPSSSQFLHKFPAHLHLNRELEGRESNEHLDQDFLRGSTVSQSFVRHLKVHKPSKGKAPPVPLETQSAKKPLKTSEALRQVLLFSKKSRSSDELLPDNYTTVETRKYYRRLDDDPKSEAKVLQKRLTDASSGLVNSENLQELQNQVVEI
ncbi:uncharacterized protein LOC111688989 [Lucilia cuprina]|uniref:uncharacterized protein LOC111688989 n=1 Tax=Lucilia cuprina TaxID=7375 RepID=UPI001F0536BB|nr:uncharacterized protein LOC111688989 [Lucilia cuprina]